LRVLVAPGAVVRRALTLSGVDELLDVLDTEGPLAGPSNETEGPLAGPSNETEGLLAGPSGG
jgi:hypothetical protein